MQQIIIIAHVIVSVLMVGIILIQQGKGAEAGASFGSGGSQTVLGATGSSSLLAKLTSFLTVMFFGLSFALAYYANFAADQAGLIDIKVPAAVEAPAPAPVNDSEIPVLESQAQPSTAPASDIPEMPAAAESAPQSEAPATAPVPASE